jgi:hypothetical protein
VCVLSCRFATPDANVDELTAPRVVHATRRYDLTYEQADELLALGPEAEPELCKLHQLTKGLWAYREAQGASTLNLPESRMVVSEHDTAHPKLSIEVPALALGSSKSFQGGRACAGAFLRRCWFGAFGKPPPRKQKIRCVYRVSSRGLWISCNVVSTHAGNREFECNTEREGGTLDGGSPSTGTRRAGSWWRSA